MHKAEREIRNEIRSPEKDELWDIPQARAKLPALHPRWRRRRGGWTTAAVQGVQVLEVRDVEDARRPGLGEGAQRRGEGQLEHLPQEADDAVAGQIVAVLAEDDDGAAGFIRMLCVLEHHPLELGRGLPGAAWYDADEVSSKRFVFERTAGPAKEWDPALVVDERNYKGTIVLCVAGRFFENIGGGQHGLEAQCVEPENSFETIFTSNIRNSQYLFSR